MAREWLLRGVKPEELVKESVALPETPKSKWENFWYHHKWTFWGGLALAVALIVMVVQLFTRDTPDYRILLLTEKTYLNVDLEVLENTLTPYGKDLDGDGKVEVHVQNIMLGDEVNQQYSSNVQMFQANLVAGDVVLFVWDQKTYEKQMPAIEEVLDGDKQFYTTLSGEDLAEDGQAYVWTNHPARLEMEQVCPASDPSKDLFPEGLYFTIRDMSDAKEDKVALYENCLEFFNNFLTDTKPTE